ncbi:glyoxalase [Acidisoma cellulosilytica]|uniref:Glyoxalase n=1 Tax=Acidisoma cellulosilyticum TaxID=2802395 RepID=A0A963Z5I4_9PROT|nr:glyoxalase [Acidisoma cellulosilyticum]MCB8882866.1 glyoxalase [Acidisoma cellulosilyticum]
MRLTILASALLGLCWSAHLAQAQPVAVGPQYDTSHVYVAPADVDRFMQSFLATFGGKSTPQAIVTVTPTPSRTSSQLLITPSGLVSLFGFRTPIPYPFGSERTGYLVQNLDKAVIAARKAGADVLVSPFPDPIGRDAVILWPGGIAMQLYWHNKAPSYPPLGSVPDNRIYLSADAVDAFVKDWTAFADATLVSDEAAAPGDAIGRPGTTFRRIRMVSGFGNLVLMMTDGHLPYPYGRETTGYGVTDLTATLARAEKAGVTLLVAPHGDGIGQSAMVAFPGGYIAEIHSQH